MTFYQKLLAIVAVATALALFVLSGRSAKRHAGGGSSILWLAAVALALMVVGIVSNTLVRHLLQILPLVLALLLTWRRSPIAPAAAAPLFAFWLLTMVAIWLFLLGLARIFTGTFTPVEIALTIVIGAASGAGLASTSRQRTAVAFPSRLATVVVFAVLQYAAMWMSAQPFAATR